MSKKVATILYKLEELSSEIEDFDDKNLYIKCIKCGEEYSVPFNFCYNCGIDLTKEKNKFIKQKTELTQYFITKLEEIFGITDKELSILLKDQGYTLSDSLSLSGMEAAMILDEIIFNIRLMISEAGLIYMKIVVDDITKDDINIVKEKCQNYIKKMDEAHEKTKDSRLVFKKENLL